MDFGINMIRMNDRDDVTLIACEKDRQAKTNVCKLRHVCLFMSHVFSFVKIL